MLPNDTCYLVGGGYDSQFANGAGLPGTATGNLNVRINRLTVGSSALGTRSFAVYSFKVPAPASVALIGLAVMFAARRRR